MAFLGTLPSPATPPSLPWRISEYRQLVLSKAKFHKLQFRSQQSNHCHGTRASPTEPSQSRDWHQVSLSQLLYPLSCWAFSVHTLFEKQNKRTAINKKWSLTFKPSLSSPEEEKPCVRRKRHRAGNLKCNVAYCPHRNNSGQSLPKYFRGLRNNPIFKGQLRNNGSVHPLAMKPMPWRSTGIHTEIRVKKLWVSMQSGCSFSRFAKVWFTITEDHF